MVGMTAGGGSGTGARWRWVAHPPHRPPVEPPAPPPPRHRLGPAWLDETPRYASTPRWGLPPLALVPPPTPAPPRPRRSAWFAARAPRWASSAARWSLAAGVVHLLRYAMLATLADRVVPLAVELGSVALVWATGLVAVVCCLLALVGSTEWLVERRRAVYDGADPRPARTLRAACLLPVATLAGPVVFLHELAADDPDALPGALRCIRRWWAVWLLDALLVALTWWRSSAEGPQAAADSVLLAGAAFLVSAWAARSTRGVIGCFADTSPRFTRRFIARGTVDRAVR